MSRAEGTFQTRFLFVKRTGIIRRFLEATMHGIVYLVGLIVIILAVLSFFGLR